MFAACVERAPLVAELLKSLGGQSALCVLSLSETGGKAAAGADRLPVAHIVAAKARQKLKQVVGKCAQCTLDEGFALRLEGRSGFLLDPEVLESGACVVGDELLAVVASHGIGDSPREDRAAQCGADGGRGRCACDMQQHAAAPDVDDAEYGVPLPVGQQHIGLGGVDLPERIQRTHTLVGPSYGGTVATFRSVRIA